MRLLGGGRSWVDYVRTSLWTRLTVLVALVVPWTLTVTPALWGGKKSETYIGVSIAIGGTLANFYRERKFWRRPRAFRQKLTAVLQTGRSSGDRELDLIALEDLKISAMTRPPNRVLESILLTALAAGFVAFPVIAAIRTSPWWLLCLVPFAVVVPMRLARRPPRSTESPLVRLDRLMESLESNPAAD